MNPKRLISRVKQTAARFDAQAWVNENIPADVQKMRRANSERIIDQKIDAELTDPNQRLAVYKIIFGDDYKEGEESSLVLSMSRKKLAAAKQAKGLYSGYQDFMKKEAMKIIKDSGLKIVKTEHNDDEDITEVHVTGDQKVMDETSREIEAADDNEQYGGFILARAKTTAAAKAVWMSDNELSKLFGKKWFDEMDVSGYDIEDTDSMVRDANEWLEENHKPYVVLDCRENKDDMMDWRVRKK